MDKEKILKEFDHKFTPDIFFTLTLEKTRVGIKQFLISKLEEVEIATRIDELERQRTNAMCKPWAETLPEHITRRIGELKGGKDNGA